MSSNPPPVELKVTGKNEAGPALNETSRQLNGVSKTADLAGRAIGGMVAFFALDRIKAFAVEMFNLGNAIKDTQTKFNTVFGQKGAAEMQAWIDANASAMGLSRQAAQESASMMGAIVQGMGASQEASAGMSKRILTLAADLQSFHNVPVEDGINSIKSALAGSWEPLDKFGIVLRQADVDARALADTNKRSAKELNNLDKAQAALNLMYERAGVAVGDLGRNQEETSNKTRYLQAEYMNMKGALATRLLPVFASMVDHLFASRKEIGRSAEAAWTLTKTLTGGLFQAVHSLTSFLAGSTSVVIGALTLSYYALADAVLATALAKEKLKRALGADNDVLGAQAALDANDANKEQAGRMMRGGLREYVRGYSLDPCRAVRDFAPAAGNFAWEAPKPIPTDPGPTDTKATGATRRRDAARRAEESQRRRAEAEDRLSTMEISAGPSPDSAALVKELGAPSNARLDESARIKAKAEETATAWREAHADMEDAVKGVVAGITDAWGGAFAMILDGTSSAKDALTMLGRATGAAMLGGLADYAGGKAKAEVAEAFSMTAKGVGYLSNPLTAPQAGPAFSSAAKHMLAAAAWGALAGGSSGAGGALSASGGGGGSGGGGRERTKERTDSVSGAGKGEATLVIEGGLLDVSDPRQEAALAAALESLSGRRVTVRGRR